jgi:hypothetical protein
MDHSRHRQIHAMGAAGVERVRDAMREESAGSGTKQVFFRHPAARQQGNALAWPPWKMRILFRPNPAFGSGKCARTGFWPGSRGRTC